MTPDQPIQTKEYFVSYTSLERKRMGEQQSRRILEGLSIDPATFRDSVEDPTREADHLFLLRHTLPQTGSITTTVSSGDCSSSAERRPIDGIQRKQG